MAFNVEAVRNIGLKKDKQQKPLLYSEQEIIFMSLRPPERIIKGGIADTPAGRWEVFPEGGAIFTAKSAEEINAITKPSVAKKIVKALKASSMMY